MRSELWAAQSAAQRHPLPNSRLPPQRVGGQSYSIHTISLWNMTRITPEFMRLILLNLRSLSLRAGLHASHGKRLAEPEQPESELPKASFTLSANQAPYVSLSLALVSEVTPRLADLRMSTGLNTSGHLSLTVGRSTFSHLLNCFWKLIINLGVAIASC